jgi:small nuclear ribonucleoprotein
LLSRGEVDFLSKPTKNTKPPTPLKVLKGAEGNIVLVKTKGGYEYVGVLELADGVMNTVLKDCVEYNENKPTLRLGRVIIRGSNIEFVSVDYARVAPDQVKI